jgi:hypothetical protein
MPSASLTPRQTPSLPQTYLSSSSAPSVPTPLSPCCHPPPSVRKPRLRNTQYMSGARHRPLGRPESLDLFRTAFRRLIARDDSYSTTARENRSRTAPRPEPGLAIHPTLPSIQLWSAVPSTLLPSLTSYLADILASLPPSPLEPWASRTTST